MIRFKPEVRIVYFNQKLAHILQAACVWSLQERIDVEINSIDDSKHGVKTLHGKSMAMDLDTVGDKPQDLKLLYEYLVVFLGRDYDVILEKDHVHVEYDPR